MSKKLFDKALSAGVSLVFMISLLAGCSDGKQQDTTSDSVSLSDSTTTSVQTDTQSSANSTETGGEPSATSVGKTTSTTKPSTGVNLGGGTQINVEQTGFGISSKMYNGIKGTKVQVVLFNQPTEIDNKLKAAFEKKYSCTVEYKTYGWAEWQTKIYQMTTAGNPPDTMIFNDSMFLSYVAKNVAMDITKYVDLKDTVWNSSVTSLFSWDGKIYGAAKADDSYIFYIYYNKNMFDDYGIKTPRQYYDEGQWTYAKFREVAAKFVKDTNRDGISDQRGFATWYWDIFIIGNNGNEIQFSGNKINITLKNSNELEGIKMIQEMQLRDKSFDHGQPNWREDFMAGKVAMIAERPWQAVGEMDCYNKCSFKIEVAPFPKGPDASANIAPGMVYSWGVPRGAKNPLGGIAWYHFSSVWGKENKDDPLVKATRNRTYKDDATYQWIMNYKQSHSVNGTLIYGLPNWWDKKWNFWEDILNNDVPPANAVDKHKPLIQGGIDTVMAAMNKK